MSRLLTSVSVRLTLWYVGLLGLVLTVLSVGTYVLVSHSLYDRFDARLDSTLQLVATALKSSTAGPGSDAEALTRALDNLRFPHQTVGVMDLSGRVLAEKSGPGGPSLRLPASPLRPSDAVQFYELPESQANLDDSCRAAFARMAGSPRKSFYSLVVTQSVEPLEDQLDLLFYLLWAVVPAVLILAGVGGWFLARSSLTPVMAMAECSQRMSADNLDQRLPITNPHDELGRLAAAFNELLARLNSSFAQQRQFMADASHELRTPLSAIRTSAQVTLQKPERSESEYREALAIIEQQAGRLSRAVEDMFALTRADMNQLPLEVSQLYLDEVIADTIRAYDVLAVRKGVRLDHQYVREAPYRGDERLLRQMVSNLLDNAIKFTPEGGTVQVGLRQTGAGYELTVTDTGCGIPAELQPRVFERFFRADKARAGANGPSGAGLGLAITRTIAELHQGRLTLQHSGPEGSTFCVSLPFPA